MAQTGKTSKKKPSQAQTQFRKNYKDERIDRQGPDQDFSNQRERRAVQRAGRMQFKRDTNTQRYNLIKDPVQYMMNVFDVLPPSENVKPSEIFSAANVNNYVARKRAMAQEMDSVPTPDDAVTNRTARTMNPSDTRQWKRYGIGHGNDPLFGPSIPAPRLRNPTPAQAARMTSRPGQMVLRPRGGMVYSLAGPLVGALGNYIGQNTSVGQQLRSKMMKQQPSRNR